MTTRSYAMALALLALCACAPVEATQCSVRVGSHGRPSATVTLSNRTGEEIVKATVLVSAEALRQGNRLFTGRAQILPGEAMIIDLAPADQRTYDFKDHGNVQRGCEVESVEFADGTRWAEPSS